MAAHGRHVSPVGSVTAPIVIRRYTPADRAAIRMIACETADRGAPVEQFFHDRELFADLLTRYYTDHDLRALWVAEADGRVIGYVTGALAHRRYDRVMFGRVIPCAILNALARGLLGSRSVWRWAQAAWRTWRAGGFRSDASLRRYPAHLHVNILEGFRGQQVGRRLVERVIEQAREAGVSGVRAAVRADNPPSCAFFERMGFRPLSRHRVIFPLGSSYQAHETVVYGKRLNG